jgi:RimJ/RimL family protein N-acetyltransferase
MGSIGTNIFKLENGSDIIIRDAKINDAEEIVNIINTIVKEEIYTLRECGEEYFTKETMEDYIKSLTENSGSLFIVAEAGNEIAGYLDFQNGKLRKTKHAGIFSIYLINKRRGSGLGKLLLQSLIDWAKGNPEIEKITLSVFSSNKIAISLYKKSGFTEEGRCPKDMKLSDGTYLDSILMYKFVK